MGNKSNKPCTIYAIKCEETGRIYIGKTQRELYRRVLEHMFDLSHGLKGNSRSSQFRKWQEDFDKYGMDSFTAYTLETDVPPEDADDVENKYMRLYKSTDARYGYNKCLNGKWGRCSGEVKFCAGLPVTEMFDPYETKNGEQANVGV